MTSTCISKTGSVSLSKFWSMMTSTTTTITTQRRAVYVRRPLITRGNQIIIYTPLGGRNKALSPVSAGMLVAEEIPVETWRADQIVAVESQWPTKIDDSRRSLATAAAATDTEVARHLIVACVSTIAAASAMSYVVLLVQLVSARQANNSFCFSPVCRPSCEPSGQVVVVLAGFCLGLGLRMALAGGRLVFLVVSVTWRASGGRLLVSSSGWRRCVQLHSSLALTLAPAAATGCRARPTFRLAACQRRAAPVHSSSRSYTTLYCCR